MNNNVPFPVAVLEEIALEGLDGITIESLWMRLSIRLKFAYPLNTNFCTQMWNYLKKQKSVLFYELVEPRPIIKVYDRTDMDVETFAPSQCPTTVYKANFISKTENGMRIRGSCQDFDTRKVIDSEEIQNMTVDQIDERWNNRFIIVGSQALRESVLIPDIVSPVVDITLQAYCLLERIGRARYNGEITQGKHSIADMVDSSQIFYLRKILFKHGLITKQPYYEKLHDNNNTTGLLLHLPRFYLEYKTKYMLLTEQVVDMLRSQPNCMMDYQQVKNEFGMIGFNVLRKLFKLNAFQKFITSELVLYRTLYPNAKEKDWKMKKNGEERSIRVLQLRDPNLEVYDMWPREVEVDDENDDVGFLYNDDERLDLELTQQAYLVVEKTGQTGITQTDFSKKLGLTRLNGRMLIKHLEKLKIICHYLQDEGRQRSKIYILSKYQHIKNNKLNELLNEINQTRRDDEVDEVVEDDAIPVEDTLNTTMTSIQSEESAQVDLSKLSQDIRPQDVTVKIERISKPKLFQNQRFSKTAMQTLRMTERMKCIISSVKIQSVIEDATKLMNILIDKEKADGYKETICRRSVIRLLAKLSVEKVIRLYSIKFTYESKMSAVMFITDVTVDATNTIFQSKLGKEKFKFLLKISNEKNRLQNLERLRNAPVCPEAPQTKSAKKTKKPKEQLAPKKKVSSTSDERKLNYGLTPKFIRMRTLHEFMFYLVYDFDTCSTFAPTEAINVWRNMEPLVNYDEIESELSTIYSLDLDWKIFVPPLLQYQDVPKGWTIYNDILQRMPVSIFVKIYNVNYEIPGLEEILAHPIRRHYLINFLPISIQNDLLRSRKHIYIIYEIVRRLCCIGLLQIGPNTQKERDQTYLFVNRYASLLDTIHSDPGYGIISNRQYPRTKYTFNTGHDIAGYWHDLYKICLNTKLGKRITESDQQIEPWCTRPEMIQQQEPRDLQDAILLDDGVTPGDKLGAGGLDSSFFAHLQRNWTYKNVRYKVKPAAKVFPAKSMKFVKRRSAASVTLSSIVAKRDRRVFVPVKGPPIRISRIMSAQQRKPTRRIRQPCYDDVDRTALALMKKLRVDWRTDEDNVLLLCKVGMLYLCPVQRRQYITTQTIRDIIHWYLKSYDKTSRACQRRIVYMMKNEHVARSVHSCLQDVRNNKEINAKFGIDFYDKLRKKYTQEEAFICALKIFYVEVVFMLNKLYVSLNTKVFESRASILPDTVDEFNQMFEQKTEEFEYEHLKYVEPKNKNEIDTLTLTTLIHSSVCCVYDKSSWSIQLYDIYKNYPDSLLAIAMNKVRTDQLISANKMSNQSKVSSRNLPLSSNPYHLSVTYANKMITKISNDIYKEIFDKFKEINSSPSLLQIPYQKLNSGACFLLAELLETETITCNLILPKKMLILDPNKYKDDDVYERINTRFQEIFEFIPKMSVQASDIEERGASGVPGRSGLSKDGRAEILKDKEKRKVKISTNEPEKIEYFLSPVEKIMKLDETMYHFFCLMAHEGVRVVVKELNISPDHYCSFDCVLSKENTIDDILTIVQDKKAFLSKIKMEHQIDRLPHTVDINEFNILYLFNVLVAKRFGEDDLSQMDEVTDHGLLELATAYANELSSDPAWFEQSSKVDDDLNKNFDVDNYVEASVDDLIHEFKMKDDIAGDVKDHKKVLKMHDIFYVSACKIRIDVVGGGQENMLQNDLAKLLMNLKFEKKEQLLKKIERSAIWSKEHAALEDFQQKTENKEESNFGESIFQFIESKQEVGATNSELVERFVDKMKILKCLHILMDLNMIMRAGVREFTYLTRIYATPWLISTYHVTRLEREKIVPNSYKLMKIADEPSPSSMTETVTGKRTLSESEDDTNASKRQKLVVEVQVDEQPTSTGKSRLRRNRFDKVTISKDDPNVNQHLNRPTYYVRIKPWLRVNGSLNRRVLDKWMGVLLAYSISNPGTNVLKLAMRFNLLQPVQIRILLEYLEDIDCIKLKALNKQKKITLFSSYESNEICPATELDSNENVFVEVLPDAASKMTFFIGEKKYSNDFV